MDRVDAIVVGAGVIGIAVARALALHGLDTVLLEREGAIGTQTSSRNSEVIHAGLYYPPGSLKARLCLRGRELLYAYCESRSIPYRRCGKLLVATHAAQRDALAKIEANAVASGVLDLQPLTRAGVNALEPALAVVAGILSPSTGIVDSHALMLSLQGDFERAGGLLALRSPVIEIDCGATRPIVRTGGADPTELAARWVVNAAGLWAAEVARVCKGLDPRHIPSLRFAKGSYFSLVMRAPFSHLVYPMPEPGGLGVHLTLDLTGRARFGPDVEWLETESPDAPDYRVDPARREAFAAAIRAYWPELPLDALQPDYAGVRPKLGGPDAPPADFVLQGASQHGVGGLLNLYGIESPGLTASLAIAEEALSRLGG
jgi:L-2-hydroxyglutarate oxidase LhgO